MKKFALIILIVWCCLHTITAQLYWKWADNTTNNHPNYGNWGVATAIDDAGNVYVAGGITDTCTIGGVTIMPRAIGDMLVMKYNKAGVLLWAKAPKGTNDGAMVQSIVPAANGDVYIAGWASTPGYFDNVVSGPPGITDHSFVARMDANGNFIWVKTCTGPNGWSHHIKTRQLATDMDNNIYFSGTIGATTQRYFDTVITAPTGGVIIEKIDPNGNVKWRHALYGNDPNGGSLSSPVMSINDKKELLYATAILRRDTAHGSSRSYSNLAIGKLDSNGQRVWHKEYGDTLHDTWLFNQGGFDMDVDGMGNFYVLGSYNGAFQIESGPGSGGNGSAFVTKFDATGTPVWSRFITGQYAEIVCGAKYNRRQNQLICAGNYRGTISFGSHTLSAGPTSNSTALFVTAYDATGAVNWIASYGKQNNITGYGTAINNQQKMFAITGRFADSTYFGSLGLYTSGANNHRDFFIAVASTDSSKETVSIPQALTGTDFKLSPNPARGYVQVEAEDLIEPVELSVLNILGQQVYSATMQSAITTIDLARFPNGHYLVMLKRGDSFLARPLILAH